VRPILMGVTAREPNGAVPRLDESLCRNSETRIKQ
jgi:hypothetical protein